MGWWQMLQAWLVGRTPHEDKLARLTEEQKDLAKELGEIQGELDEAERLETILRLRAEQERWRHDR